MKRLILVLAVILLIPITWWGIVIGNSIYRSLFNPYLDRQISGPVDVLPAGLEISPEPPLKVERQIQQVILNFATPMKPDYKSWGIVFPDGTVVVPHVQLIDQHGNKFDLKCSGLDETGIAFSSEKALPTDRKYRSVRIEVTRPIKLSSIHWKCWNQWDVS